MDKSGKKSQKESKIQEMVKELIENTSKIDQLMIKNSEICLGILKGNNQFCKKTVSSIGKDSLEAAIKVKNIQAKLIAFDPCMDILDELEKLSEEETATFFKRLGQRFAKEFIVTTETSRDIASQVLDEVVMESIHFSDPHTTRNIEERAARLRGEPIIEDVD